MMELISKLFDAIPMSGPVIIVAGLVLESLLRLVKTEKPKSLLLGAGKLLHLLSKGFEKCAMFLDMVIPQHLKLPEQK